ncbi:hypothetical protein DDM97_18000 [Vibrio cholerae]|nr:hypothetical protein [Vibrio cholerae]
MKKVHNKIRKNSAVLVVLSALFLPIQARAVPSYKIETINGHTVLTEVVVQVPDLLQTGTITSGLATINKLYVVFYSDKGNPFEFECIQSDFKTSYPAIEVAEDGSYKMREQYARELVEGVTRCQNFEGYPTNEGYLKDDDISSWSIDITDGFSYNSVYGGMYISGLTPIAPSPNHCSVQIMDNIRYGSLPQNASNILATGSLLLTCDNPTDVRVSVNHEQDLVNQDGSEISFEYDKNVDVDGGGEIELEIRANLLKGPKVPGSYSWSVPVTISYN